ncbi:MAG: hypothetical protein JRJ57_12585 [Deltaproteobacteria bacterium]|nr:hypothetical protein [Deltaproteobacteria bacterium]MBW2149679.1 hypothetical protein [Deltaproteobacteria bacterium]
MAEFLLTTLPDVLLIGIGLYLATWMIAKTLFFPSQKGVLIDLHDPFDHSCPEPMDCGFRPGSLGLPIRVKLDNDQIIIAETSPCSACMERLKPGDAVCINRIGDRVIAQKAAQWRRDKC